MTFFFGPLWISGENSTTLDFIMAYRRGESKGFQVKGTMEVKAMHVCETLIVKDWWPSVFSIE
jgi:hypothetical protein